MTSEEIVFAAVDEIYIKDAIEGPKLVISPWWPTDSSKYDHDQEDQEESTQKCGEIFRAQNGKFTLLCTQCNCNFMDLIIFGDHFRDGNCDWNVDGFGPVIRQISIPEDISYADGTQMEEWEDTVSEATNDMIEEAEAIENVGLTLQSFEQTLPGKDLKKQNKNKTEYTDQNNEKMETEDETNMTNSTLENPSEFEKTTDTDEWSFFEKESSPDDEKLEKLCKQEYNKQNPEEIPFCAACSRGYKSEMNYLAHLRKKHSHLFSIEDIKSKNIKHLEEVLVNTLKEMVCIYCYKIMNTLKEFKEHWITHAGTHLFYCKFCPKSFGSQYSRQLHMNIHEDIRPFKCSYCPRAFACPANLHNHERLHLNIRTFACKFCDKRFVKGSDRTVHERIHTKDFPCQCDECGKRFITPVVLRDHKQRHKGIKSFKCSECDKGFYSAILLRYHKQSHSLQPEFECKKCGSKFRGKKSLKQHEALHEEVKKYTCMICGKAFAQFAGLYQHKKRHELVK